MYSLLLPPAACSHAQPHAQPEHEQILSPDGNEALADGVLDVEEQMVVQAMDPSYAHCVLADLTDGNEDDGARDNDQSGSAGGQEGTETILKEVMDEHFRTRKQRTTITYEGPQKEYKVCFFKMY